MTSNKRDFKYDFFNIDKLEAIIVTAMISNQTIVYIPKRLHKMAKQMIAIKKLDLKIKTY